MPDQRPDADAEPSAVARGAACLDGAARTPATAVNAAALTTMTHARLSEANSVVCWFPRAATKSATPTPDPSWRATVNTADADEISAEANREPAGKRGQDTRGEWAGRDRKSGLQRRQMPAVGGQQRGAEQHAREPDAAHEDPDRSEPEASELEEPWHHDRIGVA